MSKQNHNNETQNEREMRMFQLGFEKEERNHKKAKDKNYLTSSPFVRPIVYYAIQTYAKEIKLAYEDAVAELNGHKQKNRVALITLIELYKLLEINKESDDAVFESIAATVWKRVCDLSVERSAERVELKSHIGHLLEEQFRFFWMEDQNKRMKSLLNHHEKTGEVNLNDFEQFLGSIESIDDPPDELRKMSAVLKNRLDKVTDNNATLNVRIQRSSDILKPRDESDLRRGYEETISENLFPPEWELISGFGREIVGTTLLDLLCVPKGVEPSDDDPRPFQIVKPENSKDIVLLRDNFVDTIEQIKEKLQKFRYSKLPLIETPNDWVYEPMSGCLNRTGGFHTTGLRELERLVRSNGVNYETIPSELTIALLNNAQKVEWSLDEPQVELVDYIGMNWKTAYDGIPRPNLMTNRDLREGTGPASIFPAVQFRDDPVNRKRLERITHKQKTATLNEDDKEFLRQWRMNKIALMNLYLQIAKDKKKFGQFTQIQTRFEDYPDKFWFAWNVDSRTRVYPIVGLGSPQGAPCERYCLRFNTAEHLSPDGQKNTLRAIGAASEGTKGSITNRIKWAESNLDLVRAIGSGGDESIRLADSCDEPLQMIQLCRQWVAHENGEPWSAPIYADATNSGFQIVSGLMNSVVGLEKTNVCRKTEDDDPNDAYTECRKQVVEWLRNGEHKITKLDWEFRNLIADVMDDPKVGRKLSKCYGRTAIYGSGARSQMGDLAKELRDREITFGETHKDHSKCVSALNALIARAYRENVGDVMTYNLGIKQMAKEFFWRPMEHDPEFLDGVRKLLKERSDLNQKGRDLGDAKITELRDYGRVLFKKCSLSGTFPDGTVIDFRRFFVEKMKIRTPFHGNPTAVITHKNSLDVTETFKATPPGIIHCLDALVLKHAYHDCPYDFTLIHDSAGSHPNNFTDLCLRYRMGFAKTMETNVIDSLGREWNVPNYVGKFSDDESWKDEIMDAIYLFN